MLKLLGVTKMNAKYMAGYVETDDFYNFFTLSMVDKTLPHYGLDPDRRFKKSEFRDYLHFARMIGKYDVFEILTRTPVEIKELSVEEIKRAIQGRPDLTVGLQIRSL
jgi:hypothetical protein